MKKLFLFSALALAAAAPVMAQEEQTPETKRVYRVPVDRPTPWTVITTSESVGISVPLIGGLTGSIYDVIDDNPFTFWQTDASKCDGSQADHAHWFMIDRGENAPQFSYVSFQQRVIDVMEGSEDNAQWDGAIDKAEVYLFNDNIGLWGGSANIEYDNETLKAYTSGHNADLIANLSITEQNRQVFALNEAHSERYILVMIKHAVNPNHANVTEDKFASLAEFNLYGDETIEEGDVFPAPYDNPWGNQDKFNKGYNENGRATYYLTLSGGYGVTSTPLAQKGCYKWYEHDDAVYDFTPLYTYKAKKGSTITITPTANGTWMQNYAFVDWDGDGFETQENQTDFLNEDGTPKEGSDLVWYAWSLSNNKNAAGQTVSNGGTPMNKTFSFTIPESTAPGIYRVRYKVDYNFINPTFSPAQNAGLGQVIIDFNLEVVDPATERTVHINFPHPNNEGETFTLTFDNVPDGVDIIDWFNAQDTPIEQAYTLLGVDGSNIVAEDNTEFTAFGSYKVAFNTPYRIKIRPQDGSSRFMIYNHSAQRAYVSTSTDKSDENILSPDRLWYFKYVDFTEDGHLKVSLHSLTLDDQIGATAQGVNDTQVTFTENPTTFVIQQVNNSNAKVTDFTLRVDGTTDACINNFGGRGILAIYKNGNNSINDDGAFIRVSQLVDNDIDGMNNFQINGVVFPIDEDKKEAAKQGLLEAWRDLFSYDEDTFVKKNGEKVYKETVGVDYTVEGVNVPGYVAYTEEHVAALRSAIVGGVTSEISAAVTALNAATLPENDNPTLGAIYTFASTDLAARGYLCNTNGNMVSSTSTVGGHAFDGSEDFQFTFVQVDGEMYMYNLGAKKFMNAFGQKTDKNDENCQKRTDHTWQFSDVPTSVRSIIRFKSAYPHSICILGGMTSGSAEGFANNQTHEGGITIVGGAQRNVLVTTGVTDRGDGCGFYATYVGKLSDEQYQALVDAVTATLTAVPMIPSEFSTINGTVNHFDEATHAKLSAYTNGGGFDHVMHLVENGTRQGFTDGGVYNLFVGNDAYKFDSDTKTYKLAEFVADDAAFNVKVVKNAAASPAADVYYDGEETYSFIHTYNNVAYPLTVNDATQHTLDLSELGKVKIGDQALVAKVGTGNAETTEISQISAEGGITKVYDLQGRRMAAPAKGINIINGKKVLVK